MRRTILASIAVASSLLAATTSVSALDANLRELFDLWDSDGDTIIAGPEYQLGGGAPEFYDLDKDGILTLEEYAEHRGQPLDGEADTEAAADAEAIVDGPALPDALPRGDYSCLHVYYDFLNKRTMMDPVGTLTVLTGSDYVWAGAIAGSYVYHPTEGVVWISGGFSDSNVVVGSVEWKGDDLMVKFEFAEPKNTITYRCYLAG